MAGEIETIAPITPADSGVGGSQYSPDRTASGRPPARRDIRVQAPAITPPDDVGLAFEVSQDGRDLVIKLVDRETHRILRQIPPEEVQRLRTVLRELVGLLLDRTG